jgi:predicted nucleic acid-binding protein
MDVLVDTSVWSLVLRRKKALTGQDQAFADELRRLFKEGRARIIGAIRQELLSGTRAREQFELLRDALREFEDIPLPTACYERAAELDLLLRSNGIAGKATDLLIGATALEFSLAIFTTDSDFEHFARVVPLHFHEVRPGT